MAGREANLPDRDRNPLPDRAANRPASFGRATTGMETRNGTVKGLRATEKETQPIAAMGSGTETGREVMRNAEATDRETTGPTGPALRTGNPRWPVSCW